MNRGVITISESGTVSMPTYTVWMTMQEIADMSPRNEEGNGDSPITVRTTMKPHVGSRMIAASVALGTAFALIAPSSALAGDATPAAASTGTTYYVSSTHGDDGNAGTDQNHPWKTLDKVNAIATDLKPGDSVLLERGSTFQDQYLHIKDTSGTADAPITIADYGDASAKPVIAANGVKGSRWYQNYRASVGNHQNKGTVSSAILLKDVSYITVKNLEITNDDPDVYDPIDTWKWTDTADSDGTKLDRSADRMDRTGVAGIAENGPSISANVTVSPLGISRRHGLPFLDGPRGLAAIPPLPFSPVGFSALMARLFLCFANARVPRLPPKS